MSSRSSKALFKRKKSSAWSRTRLNKIPKTKVEKIIISQSRPSYNQKLESKFNDTTVTSALASTTGAVYTLNAIAEGSDNNQRTGRQIMVKGLYIKGYWSSSVALAQSDFAELRLFWHKDPLAAAPTAASFLQGGVVDSLSLNNVDNEETVICLGKINCFCEIQNSVSATETLDVLSCDGTNSTAFERYIKINEKSRFNNTTGINPTSGGLYAVLMSRVASATAPLTINFVARVRYSDA